MENVGYYNREKHGRSSATAKVRGYTHHILTCGELLSTLDFKTVLDGFDLTEQRLLRGEHRLKPRRFPMRCSDRAVSCCSVLIAFITGFVLSGVELPIHMSRKISAPLECLVSPAWAGACSSNPAGPECEPPCCGWGKKADCGANQHRNKCCLCICDSKHTADGNGNCVKDKE